MAHLQAIGRGFETPIERLTILLDVDLRSAVERLILVDSVASFPLHMYGLGLVPSLCLQVLPPVFPARFCIRETLFCVRCCASYFLLACVYLSDLHLCSLMKGVLVRIFTHVPSSPA